MQGSSSLYRCLFWVGCLSLRMVTITIAACICQYPVWCWAMSTWTQSWNVSEILRMLLSLNFAHSVVFLNVVVFTCPDTCTPEEFHVHVYWEAQQGQLSKGTCMCQQTIKQHAVAEEVNTYQHPWRVPHDIVMMCCMKSGNSNRQIVESKLLNCKASLACTSDIAAYPDKG